MHSSLRGIAAAAIVALCAASVPALAGDAGPATVTLKFSEGTALRIRQGAVVSAAPRAAATAGAVGSAFSAAGVDLSGARRLIDRPEAEIDAERRAVAATTAEAVPDLNLFYVVPVPPGTTAAAFAARLRALPGVESAEPSATPAPPPVDLSPKTPSLVSKQGYRAVPPKGVGVLDAVKYPGGRGTGVTLVDVEYSWQFDHEDLELKPSINVDTGATPSDPFGDTDHGTAVLGEIFGRSNAYGVTGLATGVSVKVAPANTAQFGYNPARAISIATGKLKAGDVLVIEQQYPACGLSAYGPLEWLPEVFAAVKVATQKGIVVVEAAGNGDVNLDAAGCQGRFDRKVRNSGAIVVGAGSSAGRAKMWFSSHGSRVDVQGWGENVVTTGYGDAFAPEIRQRYTLTFGGTSSATPIVAGVVAEIQGALKGRGLKPATPAEMRAALVATGTPQSDPRNGRVGPLPATEKALQRIIANRS